MEGDQKVKVITFGELRYILERLQIIQYLLVIICMVLVNIAANSYLEKSFFYIMYGLANILLLWLLAKTMWDDLHGRKRFLKVFGRLKAEADSLEDE